jgi:hypothetical protein
MATDARPASSTSCPFTMSHTTFNVILLYGKFDKAGELFSHDDYDDENKIIIIYILILEYCIII